MYFSHGEPTVLKELELEGQYGSVVIFFLVAIRGIAGQKINFSIESCQIFLL